MFRGGHLRILVLTGVLATHAIGEGRGCESEKERNQVLVQMKVPTQTIIYTIRMPYTDQMA